jgi:serine/threonine protein kinase
VWKVTFKKNNKSYALKEMSKVKVMDRKSEKSIKNERELLAKLKNFKFHSEYDLFLPRL